MQHISRFIAMIQRIPAHDPCLGVATYVYIYIYMLWLGNTPFFPTRNVSLHAKYSYLAIAPNRSPEMWSTWPRRSTTFNFGVSTPSKAQPSQTRESSGNCRRWTRMVPALSIHLWWAHQRKPKCLMMICRN